MKPHKKRFLIESVFIVAVASTGGLMHLGRTGIWIAVGAAGRWRGRVPRVTA
jgi:hypothetical protein